MFKCKRNLTFIVFSALFFLLPAKGQNVKTFDSRSSLQYGVNAKLQIDLGVIMPEKITNLTPWSEYNTWRLSISTGIGSFAGDRNILYPSLQADLMLYQGGIGSKWPGHKRTKPFYMQNDLEFSISYTLTTGLQNRLVKDHLAGPAYRSYPLYYYNNFNLPVLQNPFMWSFSVGGNLVWFPTRNSTKFQQVGFLNLHLNRVQLSYLNDGPPFGQPLGDKYDRLHTGGGYISYHADNHTIFNLVELGFNKFTGFSKNAYELGNRIGNDFVYHRDSAQQFYNKGNIYLNVSNTHRTITGGGIPIGGFAINLHNFPKLDVQHLIHLTNQYPLHAVPNEKYVSISPILYYNTTKIGLQ